MEAGIEPDRAEDAGTAGSVVSRASRHTSAIAHGWRAWGPLLTVVALAVAFGVVFFRLAMLRHDRYSTFGFDLAIYDQGAWLAATGRDPFMTVRGLDFFGHHINVVLLLLAPFYWLGAGAKFLLLVQVIAQCSGAFAVYLLARDRIGARWPGVALAAVLLLNPTYQWQVWEFFHPDTLAIPALVFAYWAARRERWGCFVAAALLALSCKEEVALAVAVLGILVALWARRPSPAAAAPAVTDGPIATGRSGAEGPDAPEGPAGFGRQIGVVTAFVGAVWWLIASRVIIPWRNGIGPFYDTFFGDLGGSPSEVLGTLVRHPSRGWELVTAPDRRTYYWKMWGPVAFLPLLAPEAFAIAVPMVAVNILTAVPYPRDFRFHWSSVVLAATIIATVEGVARIARQGVLLRNAALAALLASAFWTTVQWGPSPIGAAYDQGYWPLQEEARVAAKTDALAHVPDGAATSAAYNLVPHLAHRERIYEFPVPWCNINWGVKGENLDDPAEVDWLAVDRQLLGERERRLFDDLVADEFAVRFDELDIVIAERVGAPAVASSPQTPVGACREREGVDLSG